MILGMSIATFTLFHVVLSLIGIAAGLVVMFGLLTGRRMDFWTAIFLAMTVATSVTGFFFPFHGLEPPHIVGIISLIVLVAAIVARYPLHLAGRWRSTYVISAAIALYLNVFVAIVQAFQKIPALRELAPKQTEPPFVIAQVSTIIVFVVVAILATRRFAHAEMRTA